MEQVGFIFLSIAIVVGFFFLIRAMFKPQDGKDKVSIRAKAMVEAGLWTPINLSYYPSDGVNGLNQKDFLKALRDSARKESTGVLRVRYRQYTDLAKRIEERHQEAMATLASSSPEWNLEFPNTQVTIIHDELLRRGKCPWR